MADIFHSLRMRASTDDVINAVTEDELLRPWWPDEGLVLAAQPARDQAVSRVERAISSSVAWRCVEGPEEWVGTDIMFAFARDGGDTVVRFAHRNWRDTSDSFAECTTKWGRVLLALKARVETPDADDVHA